MVDVVTRARYALGIHAGEPLTPVRVETEIMQCLDAIESVQVALDAAIRKAGDAAAAYEVAYAREIVRSDARSKEQREAQALLGCEQLYLDKIFSESTVKVLREEGHNLRAILEGLRSLGASVRSSFENAR